MREVYTDYLLEATIGGGKKRLHFSDVILPISLGLCKQGVPYGDRHYAKYI